MATVKPGKDRAATARKLIEQYGAENVRTRSEIGVGVVFEVPDAKPEPEPKKAPPKKAAPAAPKPADTPPAAAD